MNRLSYLQQTLPQNLKDNEDFDSLEFVLLNYNSSDEIDTWVRDSFSQLIQEKRLVYVCERAAPYFHPAHSRNVCARMANGHVICNVDADNYTGQGFASFLWTFFREDQYPVIVNTYDLYYLRDLPTHGRIAVRKWHFMRTGGYEESFIGWGGEDGDLNRRCMAMGFRRFEIPKEYLRYIDHSDSLRVEKIDFSALRERVDDPVENKLIGNTRNWKRSKENVEKHRLVANVGQGWGLAVVWKNFSEQIRLETTWAQ